MASDCKLSRLFSPAVAVTSSSWSTATPKKLEHVLNLGVMRISYSENMMKIERKIYMQETNKQVVTITDEGIIIIDYLVADYEMLVNLIAGNNCILIFDSEDAYNALNEELKEYIKDVCSIELAEQIMKFIADEYNQQVSILNFISHD